VSLLYTKDFPRTNIIHTTNLIIALLYLLNNLLISPRSFVLPQLKTPYSNPFLSMTSHVLLSLHKMSIFFPHAKAYLFLSCPGATQMPALTFQ